MGTTLELTKHQLALEAPGDEYFVQQVRRNATSTTEVVDIKGPPSVPVAHLLDLCPRTCCNPLDSLQLTFVHAILEGVPQS